MLLNNGARNSDCIFRISTPNNLRNSQNYASNKTFVDQCNLPRSYDKPLYFFTTKMKITIKLCLIEEKGKKI